MPLDFVVWGPPASGQSKGTGVKRWQEKVAAAAREAIPEESKVIGEDVSVLLIFFHAGDLRGDLDNMAKSTLDGMCAVAFGDDRQIAQLIVRRTSLNGLLIADPPPRLDDALSVALDGGKDFVYVRIDQPPDHRKLP